MRHAVKIFAIGMLGLLAACGTQPKERASGGAAAGAATGAAVGALGGPPGMAVGALVGGGAGAATGAATTPKDVNLGKPPWTNPEARVPTLKGPVGRGRSARAARVDTSHDYDADRLNEQSLSRGESSFH
jgi:hypothetical protein